MKARSIAQKIGIWLVLVTFFVMVVFGAINYFLFINQLDKDLNARLDESSSRVTDLLALHVWNLDNLRVQEVAQEQAFLESFAQLRVSDNFGDLIYETEHPTEDRKLVFIKKDIIYAENVAGSIEAAFSTENLEVAKNAVIRSTLVIIFVVALTVLVLAFFIARSISKPIKDLTQTAEKIASGDLNVKANVTSKDEIGALGKTFNLMTGKLKKQIKELQELDRLKDDFLNNTTHELKTPLIPIKSQTQLLLSDSYGALNKEQKESIEMILKNETHLENLISDVMDISKLHSKKIKFVFEEADLKPIIEGAVKDIEELAKERGIALTLKSIPELPKLQLDAKRITQVIGNLLNNALKFTGEGGAITVIVEKTDKDIITTVADTGIGMSKETLEKLFTPFFQADSDAARKYPGTGLGLSISKSFVEAHGGTIKAESPAFAKATAGKEWEGKGSAFIFTLPIPKDP